MKKIKLIILLWLIILSNKNLEAQIGSLKATSDRIQIGYQNYRWLGLGFSSTSPSAHQSQWAIEHWDGGLNFWKPSGSVNAGNYKLYLSDNGFVGINMKAMSHNGAGLNALGGWMNGQSKSNLRLQVNGNVGSSGYYVFSDSAIKTNVVELQNALSDIMKLRPVSYNYNNGLYSFWKDSTITTDSNELKQASIDLDTFGKILGTENKRIGFIAQEVEKIYPTLVATIGNTHAINYVELVPVLIKGMQEQQSTIDSLNLQIQNLRQEIINWQGRSIDTNGLSKSRLFQNTPNPFDGITKISYFIDENINISIATIEVRDIMGNLKATLALGDRSGIGEVDYDGSSLTQGYYIYTLKVNGGVKDSKMFLKEQ